MEKPPNLSGALETIRDLAQRSTYGYLEPRQYERLALAATALREWPSVDQYASRAAWLVTVVPIIGGRDAPAKEIVADSSLLLDHLRKIGTRESDSRRQTK